jgi:glutathione S-transferase
MILIGQYDSPFVRRVGIALMLYGLPFEHKPWSTFSDADKIRSYNPLTRVPTLVLDDGAVLTESHIILDYLDSLLSEKHAMFPRAEPARHRALAVTALATGLGEKAVSLFYEKALHKEVSEVWIKRCLAQITATLAVLEADRAGRAGPYWFGEHISHADIAVACVLRFVSDAHGAIISLKDMPALLAHSARMEELPVFKTIMQPFVPPTS